MELSKEEMVKRGILPQNRPVPRGDQSLEAQREPMREEPRKKRRFRQGINRLEIPKEFLDPNFDYNWKRRETAGKEDNHYMADLHANWWVPVTAEEIPQIAQHGQTQGPLTYGDLIYMKREKYLSEEAQNEVEELTQRRVQSHRKSLIDAPDGTFSRAHPNLQNNIRKSTDLDEFTTSTGKSVMI